MGDDGSCEQHCQSRNAVAAENKNGHIVSVALVHKRNAKTAKTTLEKEGLVDKRFRMTSAAAQAVPSLSSSSTSSLIAIPVLPEYFESETTSTCSFWFVEAMDQQFCPYSSAMLGSRQQVVDATSSTTGGPSLSLSSTNLSAVQLVLYSMIMERKTPTNSSSSYSAAEIVVNAILQLDSTTTCPSKLEILGDDGTVVIPPKAFQGEEFLSVLRMGLEETNNHDNDDNMDDNESLLMEEFWKRLADAYKTTRIVQRGAIDPNSKVRESGHRLVWPIQGIPATTGPETLASWICVTEQGIKQSFDVTRVMFSRGNISEKIRFGKTLVQEGEVVLDMYAGIGYYTLPAVIHGRAAFVYACEWNEHAANALQYNVADNGVQDKVKIMIGDCRKTTREFNIVNLVDRVSLGLLPSSEGGWRTAVRALKDATGGWLHIHGNVPNKERDSWALWVCSRLSEFVQEEGKNPKNNRDEWIVVCSHVERVKSFAPTVSHFVADVFLGLPKDHPSGDKLEESNAKFGVVLDDGDKVILKSENTSVPPPSCALSSDGVLSQAWMR